MERVHRHRFEQTANGDDDAGVVGHGLPETRQRDRHAIDQGPGEQPGERAEQSAGVGKVYGKVGLSAGRQGRQVRIQATSFLVSGIRFSPPLFTRRTVFFFFI